MRCAVWLAGLVLVTALGCSTLKGDYPRSGAIVPDGALRLTPRYKLAHADALTIAGAVILVYYLVDPLAPNWEIAETRLDDKHIRFELRMKNFSLGGSGEAREVFVRRAESLAREKGAAYRIERYEESIDSRILFPYRKLNAEILLLDACDQKQACNTVKTGYNSASSVGDTPDRRESAEW